MSEKTETRRKAKKRKTERAKGRMSSVDKDRPGSGSTGKNTSGSDTSRDQSGRAHTDRDQSGRAHTDRDQSGRAHTGRNKSGRVNTGRSKSGRVNAGRSKSGRVNAGRTNTRGSHSRIKAGSGNTGKKNSRGGLVGAVLVTILFAVSTVLAFATTWLLTLWANLSMEEVVFHLSTTIEGTNPDMVYEALLKYGLPALLIIVAFLVLLAVFRKKKLNRRPLYLLALLVSIIELAGVCYFLETRLKVIEYFRDGGDYSTFIEDNFVDAGKTKITFPKKKRNLIYIYLESMEDTFADKSVGGSGAWDKNIIPGLTKISENAEDFSGSKDTSLNGAQALTGATWTMGGIFAQTTGLPLKVSINSNGMNLMDHFFEKLTGLGDILEENGYKQVFLCGSDIVFGGRALYFQDHGNYALHDYIYAKKQGYIPKDYLAFWGYEDEKLYEYAKREITELAKGDQPFNYSMLTVDTHPEDGYVCELCGKEFGDNQYANVFHCADRQVSDFIAWLKEQDFYDNTTVIINGDHCTMDSDFCNDVDSSYRRRTYTAYLNAPVEPALDKRRLYTTMDCFPTTLAALGVEIEGDRLGLGTNLFSDRKTLLEEFGSDKLDSELKKNSKLMEELADINLAGGVIENVRKQTVVTFAPVQIPENSVNVTVNMDYAFKEAEVDKVEMVFLPDDSSQPVKVKTMQPVYNENGGRSCYAINLTEEDLSGQGMNISVHIKMASGEEYYLKAMYFSPEGIRYMMTRFK